MSLTAILDELQLRWIDFAILDTEGAELAILQTVDWARIRFGVLVVECIARTRPAPYRQQVINVSKQEQSQFRDLSTHTSLLTPLCSHLSIYSGGLASRVVPSCMMVVR